MQANIRKGRNTTLDIIRGCAMLMVILGHTISGNNIVNYEDSILFKIIWSLQMPLFILISGYVTVFSKPIDSAKDLLTFIKKRTLTYILPWVMWTFFIHGFLMDGWNLMQLSEKIKYVLWNMDSGYWFLFSLWTICMIWGVGNYFAGKMSQREKIRPVFTSLISIVLAGILIIAAKLWGMSFLAIKYSLYYLIFYYIGYLYSHYISYFDKKDWFANIKQIFVAVSLIVFAYLTVHCNTYSADDSLVNIAIRLVSSIAGCAVFISAVSFWITHSNNGIPVKIQSFILLAGQHSLGLYLSHYLFLSILPLAEITELISLTGFVVCLLNYLLVILVSSLTVNVISHNKWSKLLLLGKKSKKKNN